MLDNKAIEEKIRALGKKAGLHTDMAICEKCNFSTRTQLGKMGQLKTAPQLDTLEKFAKGLGVQIEDLIYDRTDADIELSKILPQLSEYEKTEVVVYAKMIIKEKNAKTQKAA